jgi:hypothetical protein
MYQRAVLLAEPVSSVSLGLNVIAHALRVDS